MENTTLYTVLSAGLIFFGFWAIDFVRSDRPNLSSIPAVGYAGILSYLTALKCFWNARDTIQEGYDKYRGTPFKVPFLSKWVVVISGPKLVNDVRQAREEDLSSLAAVGEVIQMKYTLGSGIREFPYHIKVIQSSMTKKWALQFADIKDEIFAAFEDAVPLKGDEWVSLPCLQTIVEIVCRATNRLFVGLPLCRNQDYKSLNIDFTMDIVIRAVLINAFPKFLHPIVGPLFSPLPRAMKRARVHLTPLIEERLRQEEEFGEDWPDRPNDLISWLLEGAQGDQRTPDDLIQRILLVNFAGIHTSANSFTFALYHLATRPEYVQPMREEVEAAIKEEGWTKAAVRRMIRVDSFLREAQRFNGFGSLNMNRKVLNRSGFTFSDGTTLPYGTFMAVAILPTHRDEGSYPNPDVFDGFRFSNMREVEGDSIKYHMVTTSLDYVAFGHGRHACPGRFFAANELKIMLAYVLLTYDIKLKDGGGYPPDEWLGPNSAANMKAEIMFRRRQVRAT